MPGPLYQELAALMPDAQGTTLDRVPERERQAL